MRGVERSTFIIGPDRTLLNEWRGVKVAGHAQVVLDFVMTMPLSAQNMLRRSVCRTT